MNRQLIYHVQTGKMGRYFPEQRLPGWRSDQCAKNSKLLEKQERSC